MDDIKEEKDEIVEEQESLEQQLDEAIPQDEGGDEVSEEEAIAHWASGVEKELGLDEGSFGSYDSAEDAVLELSNLVRQTGAQLQQYRQQAAALQQAQAQLAANSRESQQEAAAQTAQEEYISQLQQLRDKWKAPEWNPELEAGLTFDEDGKIVALPGYDPNLPQQYLAYKTWRDKTQDAFLRDPYQFFEEHYQPIIQEQVANFVGNYVGQAIGQVQAQQHGQATANQILSENAPWLFAQSEDGEYILGSQGEMRLSRAGQVYYNTLESLKGSNIDQHTANQLAIQAAYAAVADDAPAQQTAEESRDAKDVKTLKSRAKKRTNRKGVTTQDKVATAPSLEEAFREALDQEGVGDDDL